MAWHLCGWRQTIEAPILAELDLIPDDVLTRSGTKRFLVPADYRFVQFAVATGGNLTDARLRTPSLTVRRMDVVITPHRRGGQFISPGWPEVHRPPRPVMLAPTEELTALASEDASGADTLTVLCALGPETLPPAPAGDVRTIVFQGNTTLTPGVWTTVPVTPEYSLEPGSYSLTGFIPISANCIAARVIFPAGTYRPGYPGFAGTYAVANDFNPTTISPFWNVNLGTFTHITIPQFQFLASAADTVQTVVAFVVKVG